MADTITWNIAKLVSEWRKHTGRSQTTDISDEEVRKLINDYYVNQFPNDAQADEFDTFFTQALSATDDGVYALATDVDRLDDPVTINGNEIVLYRDRENFFSNIHGHHRHFSGSFTLNNISHLGKFEDEQFITDPTLVIGSSDSTKVKHSDFDYRINEISYSKLSSEVALTGDVVPEDKYGAWSLRIDEDGDITVTAATDNASGYLTPRLALEALASSDSVTAYMGYVTVIKSDGAFTPATTALDADNVTATFTDGRFETRTTPIAALLYGSDLYVHPKPNDIYEFKALQIADRPTALETATVIADAKWGPMIALGAAIIYLKDIHDSEGADELLSVMKFHRDGVRGDKIKRLLGGEIIRQF